MYGDGGIPSVNVLSTNANVVTSEGEDMEMCDVES